MLKLFIQKIERLLYMIGVSIGFAAVILIVVIGLSMRAKGDQIPVRYQDNGVLAALTANITPFLPMALTR